MKLKNKIAIITGGGRGIGKAVALAYVHEGAHVALISRTLSDLQEVAQEIKSFGGKALVLQGDISKKKDVDRIVYSVVQNFGRIDILVNNAGVLGPIGLVTDNDVQEWQRTIKTNLFGTMLCCRAVLSVMVKQHEGKILNLSGGGATSPRPRFSAYAASKSAVIGLTATLAEEMKPYNIQINAVAPGAIYTRLHEQVLAANLQAGEKELKASICAKSSGDASLQKVTELAIFLASDDSYGLTGRLISAVWDDWRSLSKDRIEEILTGDLYTLRRIDNALFCPKTGEMQVIEAKVTA
jgi:3-oxoacyl-[acyl-carrier protein] reductase